MRTLIRQTIASVLRFEARLILKKYKPRIVAITGTVGKTGTKEAIFHALAPEHNVRKSEKSYNNELGVPLTIIGRGAGGRSIFSWIGIAADGLSLLLLRHAYPDWLVLEVGIDRPGDMSRLTQWLTPDIVVVTQLSTVPVHVEFFDSPEAVHEEKAKLVDALPDTGTLILNSDDPLVYELRKRTHATIRSYGFGEEATLRAAHFEVQSDGAHPIGMQFKVLSGGNSVPVAQYGTLGRHHVYEVLAALSVGASLGANMMTMLEGLTDATPPPGRSRIIRGVKDTTIIDDSYNASPIAVEEALRTLADVNTGGRKIACLGDMLELGKYSAPEHKRIGKLVAETCDMLVTVGPRAQDFAEGALIAEMSEKCIFQFDDVARAGKMLEHEIAAGDVVLVKGSQSMRMEHIVAEIMAEPEKKGELLVRQGKEWKGRS